MKNYVNLEYKLLENIDKLLFLKPLLYIQNPRDGSYGTDARINPKRS